MTRNMKRVLFCLFITFLSQCIFSQKYMFNLQKLRVGMSKNEVLKTLGTPNNQFFYKKTKTRRIVYNMFEHQGGYREPTIPCCVELVNDSVTRWGKLIAGELVIMDELNNFNVIYNSDTTKYDHPMGVEDQLKVIKEYYDKGLISEEEFKIKKKEILDLL